MFVDACAMISIMAQEDTANVYRAALDQAADRFTSPLAAWEAILVMARPGQLDCSFAAAEAVLIDWLEDNEIDLREPTPPSAVLSYAVAVADQLGVGKRALSNFDCFHYAHAKAAGVPLLTLDALLRQTDVETLP